MYIRIGFLGVKLKKMIVFFLIPIDFLKLYINNKKRNNLKF
jgi:hypothetical protein